MILGFVKVIMQIVEGYGKGRKHFVVAFFFRQQIKNSSKNNLGTVWRWFRTDANDPERSPGAHYLRFKRKVIN